MTFSAQLQNSGNTVWSKLLSFVLPINGVQCNKAGTEVTELSLEAWAAMFGHTGPVVDPIEAVEWSVDKSVSGISFAMSEVSDDAVRVKIHGGVPEYVSPTYPGSVGLVWYWTVTAVVTLMSGVKRARSIWLRVQG